MLSDFLLHINDFSVTTLTAIIVIVSVSAFIHGLIGVGFPLITTPLIATLTDVKTAVLITIIPNITLNLLIIFRGKHWLRTAKKFFLLSLSVTLGTLIGSKILVIGSELVLKGILLFMLTAALLTSKIRFFQFDSNKRRIQFLFGFIAGVMGGSVNISVPFLTMYLVNTDLSPTVMSQIFNICFIVNKVSQAIMLIIDDAFGNFELVSGLMLSLFAVLAQRPGLALQNKISAKSYKSYLHSCTALITLFVLYDFISSLLKTNS